MGVLGNLDPGRKEQEPPSGALCLPGPAQPCSQLRHLLPGLGHWEKGPPQPRGWDRGFCGGMGQSRCRLLPLDLGPSGTAVLHVDRVRRGSRGVLWEETIVPWTLLPGLAQARWRWVDFPPR